MSRPWEWPVDPDGYPKWPSQDEDQGMRISGERPWRSHPNASAPKPSPYYPPRVGRHERQR